jgi:hypothetical protein
MYNVNMRRRFQPLNEGDDLWTEYTERADEKHHEFCENVVRGDEGPPLLPPLAIESHGRVVVRLRAINKTSPARSIRKDVRHQRGLRGPHDASCP